ncbi:MAG: HAMP domain-containing sensor histidine kinase, partial [Myxococcota bacterium]
MAVVHLMILAGSPSWVEEMDRLRVFAGNQFELVWDEPERREALMHSVSRDLELNVQLMDKRGQIFATHGEEDCSCHSSTYSAPVRRDGVQIGTVVVCSTRGGPPKYARLFLLLSVVALILWIGSGMVARSIARPLNELAEVAEAMGQGDLRRRASRSKESGGEIEILADALHDMAGRIERQITDQKTLLAGVSHELRTPLGHMRLITEMMRDVGASPKRIDQLDQEIVEMDDLVDQLLAHSRLSFELRELRPVDVVAMTTQAMERAGLPPELLEVSRGGRVVGDSTLLLRALANLLRNAHVHGGGATRVLIEHRDSSVFIGVEDAGPGLPESERQLLFEPFVHKSIGKTSSGSLGLGLFLVKRIAAAHGGDVLAEENHPQGARIGLLLPL